MTLLESVMAFVLLAVVGVTCLDLSRGASGLAHRSAEWSRAVAAGESALSAAASGVPDAEIASDSVRVSREPWAEDAGVDVVTVTVTLAGGAEFRASRLVRAERAMPARTVR